MQPIGGELGQNHVFFLARLPGVIFFLNYDDNMSKSLVLLLYLKYFFGTQCKETMILGNTIPIFLQRHLYTYIYITASN